MMDESKHCFIDAKEAAQRLGVSKQTLYGLVRKGKIPGVRLGRKILRIPADALEELPLNGNRATENWRPGA